MRLIAHNIRSLHNVGSFFRTADVFGVERMYLTGYTGQPPRKEIAKTALGSEHRIPWERADELAPLLVSLRAEGFRICALEIAEHAVSVADWNGDADRTVLLLGSEVDGIDVATLELCDEVVCIPMQGRKKSLNVSVATGIALFAMQQKKR